VIGVGVGKGDEDGIAVAVAAWLGEGDRCGGGEAAVVVGRVNDRLGWETLPGECSRMTATVPPIASSKTATATSTQRSQPEPTTIAPRKHSVRSPIESR